VNRRPLPALTYPPEAYAQAPPPAARYVAAARGGGGYGAPAVCAYEHRRGNAAAAFLVGPVFMAEAALACSDHLTTAVRQLAAQAGSAWRQGIPVKVLVPAPRAGR
jgi:hypothetical protein